jgi:hypothetical protein
MRDPRLGGDILSGYQIDPLRPRGSLLARADILLLCYTLNNNQRDTRQVIHHKGPLGEDEDVRENQIHVLLVKHDLRSPYEILFSKCVVSVVERVEPELYYLRHSQE